LGFGIAAAVRRLGRILDTSSGPAGHLLLKEKAFGGIEFVTPPALRATSLIRGRLTDTVSLAPEFWLLASEF